MRGATVSVAAAGVSGTAAPVLLLYLPVVLRRRHAACPDACSHGKKAGRASAFSLGDRQEFGVYL